MKTPKFSINSAIRITDGIDAALRPDQVSFFEQLKPASYRGVPFVVLQSSAQFGRRSQLHEYPFRDDPWIEDLGRAAGLITVRGFLVGDDIIARRARLIKEVEKKGDGTLVHPTLGKKVVVLMTFTSTEIWDKGRVFELEFQFREAGQRHYPKKVKPGDAPKSDKDFEAANAVHTASVRDYGAAVRSALLQGARARREARLLAAGWASLVRAVTTFGRNPIVRASAMRDQMGPGASDVDVWAETKATAARARKSIDDAMAAVDVAAEALDPASTEDFASSVLAAAVAIRKNAPTPGEAVRQLATMLRQLRPTTETSGDAQTVQQETFKLIQRVMLTEMVLAAAAYAPVNEEDAVSLRQTVVAALDEALLIAGDDGDDGTFARLQAIKAVIVESINVRAAALPEMRDVMVPGSLPSLVLAHRLYGNVKREGELVQQAKPRHPAFMPPKFRAPSK